MYAFNFLSTNNSGKSFVGIILILGHTSYVGSEFYISDEK